jgi:hypothetical protein
MTREEIKDFIREVFGFNQLTEDHENWVSIRCPFAPFKHERGFDSRPSAGISIKENGHSIFNCYSCHTKGTLPYILRQLEFFTGEDWNDLADSIEEGAFLGAHVPEWGSHGLVDKILEPLDKETYLGLFDACDPRHPYLRKRGITPQAAIDTGLLYDPSDSENEPRIVFPVYGRDNELYGFTGRATRKEARLKVRDYYGLPKRSVLLGQHLVKPSDRFIILVEGIIDYARMVGFDLPANAFMSSTLTDAQVEIVKDIGLPTYFFHDNDTAGLDAQKSAKKELQNYVPFLTVTYPREATVFDEELNRYRAPADPAELTLQQIEHMMDDAEL